MRLLLDTHILLWFSTDPQRLSRYEHDLLASASTQSVVSTVSLWELRLKWHSFFRSGDRKGPMDPMSISEWVAGIGYSVLPLTHVHAVAELDHPLPHKDPFDELLLVQAQVEGLRLLTRDARLIGHPLVLAA